MLSRLVNAAFSVLDRQRYKVVLIGQGLVPRLAQQLRHLTMLLGCLPKRHTIPPRVQQGELSRLTFRASERLYFYGAREPNSNPQKCELMVRTRVL
jgi:hypothetical protein